MGFRTKYYVAQHTLSGREMLEAFFAAMEASGINGGNFTFSTHDDGATSHRDEWEDGVGHDDNSISNKPGYYAIRKKDWLLNEYSQKRFSSVQATIDKGSDYIVLIVSKEGIQIAASAADDETDEEIDAKFAEIDAKFGMNGGKIYEKKNCWKW